MQAVLKSCYRLLLIDIYLKINYQEFECKAQFTLLNNGVEAIPDYVLNALDNGAEVCRGKLAWKRLPN